MQRSSDGGLIGGRRTPRSQDKLSVTWRRPFSLLVFFLFFFLLPLLPKPHPMYLATFAERVIG